MTKGLQQILKKLDDILAATGGGGGGPTAFADITGAPEDNAALASALSAPYLVYTALLTQTGTDAPVATVLQNTLGGVPVWSYNGVGEYRATLTGILTGKIIPQQWGVIGEAGPVVYFADKSNDDRFNLKTYAGGALSDDILSASFIEVRVYPA